MNQVMKLNLSRSACTLRLATMCGLTLSAAGLARADFAPIPLTAGSFTQDAVVEKTAPRAPSSFTTASMDSGTGDGRIHVVALPFANLNSTFPKIYTAHSTLAHTSPVTSITLTYSSGGGHAGILAVSGLTGRSFQPITVTGYNKDIIVEATG